jgi:hypothetical protein
VRLSSIEKERETVKKMEAEERWKEEGRKEGRKKEGRRKRSHSRQQIHIVCPA